jgi:septum formation protein
MNPLIGAEAQSALVLASASPRRREILERLGFEFEVVATEVDERFAAGAEPGEGVVLVASRKAAAARSLRPAARLIAADTVVVCGGAVLGKPADAGEAASMLVALSGRTHEVVTGLALEAPDGRALTGVERTRVRFRALAGAEIEAYIGTGEPFGKAGAYAIQGLAAPFVEGIDGCYFNVVGLPVSLLFRLLVDLARSPRENRRGGV